MKDNECLIDVHCHLDMLEKDLAVEKAIENAAKAGVNIIVAQGVNPKSNRRVLEIAAKYKEVKVALGLYPIDALSLTEKEIEQEIEFIRQNRDKIWAIGEVGLDFKEDENNHDRQISLFEKIILLAKEMDKPLIIHSRKAEKIILDLLEKHNIKKAIMHCFSGNFKLVKRIVDNSWFITIPTSVKNSEHFQKIIKEVNISHLLCETDSPYLHPDKQWPNQPSNVSVSYRKIAEIKKISLEEAKNKIFENYQRLFL